MDYKRLSASRLRSERKNRGWTLTELANHTDTLTPERISNYEQARRYMSPEVAAQLSKVLGSSMAWLMGVDGSPLTDEEKHLLNLYRNASEHEKHIISSVAEAQVKYDASPHD